MDVHQVLVRKIFQRSVYEYQENLLLKENFELYWRFFKFYILSTTELSRCIKCQLGELVKL